jgi:hypothetical protein
VTITFTVKNTGAGAVARVPWAINLITGANQGQTLAQGEQTSVGPGATFTVTAQWTATAGQRVVQGYVDPSGTTFKNTAPVSAQIKELTLSVAQASAATQGSGSSPLVTQLIDYQKAKMGGARFSDGPEGFSTCTIGQADWSSSPGIAGGDIASTGTGVLLRIICDGLSTGGRGNPEAFASFTLKNGWKVKSVEMAELVKRSGDWGWDTRPAVGSNNPYMKMHMWATTGGQVSLNVKIWIEGPQGTNPYE